MPGSPTGDLGKGKERDLSKDGGLHLKCLMLTKHLYREAQDHYIETLPALSFVSSTGLSGLGL